MPKSSKIIGFILILLAFIPFINVNAASATVYNEETLKEAIKNRDIDTIALSSNIETHEKINITRDLTINGNNHSITYVGTFKGGNDKTVWDSIYVIQVYRAKVTIKDIKLTGGNAGLLVNGAEVKLEGKIDLSDNGWGGIEVAKGIGVTDTPKLALDENTQLVNTSETSKKPTIWVPDDTEGATIIVDDVAKVLEPGTELEIEEYQELFDINPETNDSIVWFSIIGLMGFITLGFSLKKLKTIK